MRKKTQNYILFVFLFFLGLFEAISGFVLWLALPCGGGGGGRGRYDNGATFWSLSRNTWTALHNWVAVALLAIVIIHIILHWKWIVYMTKSYFQKTQ